MVWGRLYHLHAGFPALEVPEGLILARGTADPLVDARRQQENFKGVGFTLKEWAKIVERASKL